MNSLTGVLLLFVLLLSSPLQAHVVLQNPEPRTPDAGLIISPCGGKAAGASVATYSAGSYIEISFNLTVQHSATTEAYISYDDFATRSKLGMMRTPKSGVYTLTAPIPAQPLGPAVIQINHQNYYSCADVTVEEAPAFVLNAGLNDAWYNPATDGQGFFIVVFPELNLVSLAWFTYDTELPPQDAQSNLGDAGHRWLTAVGPIEGNRAMMNINMTSGGLFNTPTDVVNTDPPGADGTIIVTFENCNSATIEYDITSIDKQGVVPIQRIAGDNLMLCEALKPE